MNKLKNTLRNIGVLVGAFFLAIVETLLVAVGIVLAGTVAMIIIPVLVWIGNGVLAKAKLVEISPKGLR